MRSICSLKRVEREIMVRLIGYVYHIWDPLSTYIPYIVGTLDGTQDPKSFCYLDLDWLTICLGRGMVPRIGGV